MRILFVSERAPYLPCPDAGRADAAHLLLALGTSHEVGVLATAEPIDTELQRRWTARRAVFAEILPAARWRRPLTGEPDLGLIGLRAAFERRVRGFAPDVVYLHGAMLAPLAAAARTPSVLATHASRPPAVIAPYSLARMAAGRLAGWLAERGDEAWARRWFPAATACIVPSDDERAAVARWVPSDRLDVVPPALDLDRYPFRRTGDVDRIALAADVGYRPHAEAALRVATSVLPRIRRVRPRAELIVMSTAPVPVSRRLAALAGVRVLAPVGDLRPSLWSAAVCISALGDRLIRGFVPQAMALGTPVVAARGTVAALPDVAEGHHVLVADRPDDVAEAVLTLLGQPVIANTLARNARELVERRYGWRAVAPQYEAVVTRVAGGTDRPIAVAA